MSLIMNRDFRLMAYEAYDKTDACILQFVKNLQAAMPLPFNPDTAEPTFVGDEFMEQILVALCIVGRDWSFAIEHGRDDVEFDFEDSLTYAQGKWDYEKHVLAKVPPRTLFECFRDGLVCMGYLPNTFNSASIYKVLDELESR